MGKQVGILSFLSVTLQKVGKANVNNNNNIIKGMGTQVDRYGVLWK
jgi:hypothetical protein